MSSLGHSPADTANSASQVTSGDKYIWRMPLIDRSRRFPLKTPSQSEPDFQAGEKESESTLPGFVRSAPHHPISEPSHICNEKHSHGGNQGQFALAEACDHLPLGKCYEASVAKIRVNPRGSKSVSQWLSDWEEAFGDVRYDTYVKPCGGY